MASSDRRPSLLQCARCMRTCQDATVLPCFHTVCIDCFQSACVNIEEGTGRGSRSDNLSCPVCTEEGNPAGGDNARTAQNIARMEGSPLLHGNLHAPTQCDLCTDGEVAVSHCEVCSCYLCDFCEQSHRRQRRTSDHPLVLVDTLPQVFNGDTTSPYGSLGRDQSSGVDDQPDVCKSHPDKLINLFCENCQLPLCQVCSAEHQDHSLLSIADVNAQYSNLLEDLVAQTKSVISSLNESMVAIEVLLCRVQESADCVAKDVCDYIDTRIRALHDQKRSLLSQLDSIKHHKERTLELQLEKMKKVLDEVNVSCTMAVSTLRDKPTTTNLFAVKLPLAAHLEELVTKKHEYTPNEDEYIKFFPNLSAGQCRGFEMYGVLDARGPSAAHSVVEGEGLFEARQRKMASFTVIIHDRYGQRRYSGGDRVEARMQSRTGTVVNAQVTDNHDGTYVVSYTPELVGEYRLSVLVDRKHVRSSPFVVNVRPRHRKHRGIFHCCSFCSSGGKKHVTCGCGGVMPGGYSGCGHGHAGHPGFRHWSCCGVTAEHSDCLL